MTDLQGTRYIPELITWGKDETHQWIVMELIGPSLSTIRWSFRDGHLSRYTGFFVAAEMLKCIEAVHKGGYVHRDIKPGNFLLRGGTANPVVIIDFGLSRRYVENGTTIPPRETVGFVGTAKYASIRTHEGKEQCRGDDLIGWFYTIVELLTGKLPWPASKDRELTLRWKNRTPIAKLCKHLPEECTEIYQYVSHLDYYDTPDYARIYRLLTAARNRCHKHKKMDWDKLRSRELKQISPLDIREKGISNPKVFHSERDISGPSMSACTIM
jgi:serine/threonine protein kinase